MVDISGAELSVRDQYLLIALWHLIDVTEMHTFSSSDFDARHTVILRSPWLKFIDQNKLDLLVQHGVEISVETGLLEVDEDPYAGLMFSLADSLGAGWKKLETTPIKQKQARFGDEWFERGLSEVISELADNSSNGNGVANTSKTDEFDDIWEPLPLDRNSKNYIEAISASEKAVEAIEQSNGFPGADPEVRDAIVITTKSTLQALKEATPSKDQIISGLLKPMKYIAKKFGDAGVGVLAKSAVAALAKFLGLPL